MTNLLLQSIEIDRQAIIAAAMAEAETIKKNALMQRSLGDNTMEADATSIDSSIGNISKHPFRPIPAVGGEAFDADGDIGVQQLVQVSFKCKLWQ